MSVLQLVLVCIVMRSRLASTDSKQSQCLKTPGNLYHNSCGRERASDRRLIPGGKGLAARQLLYDRENCHDFTITLENNDQCEKKLDHPQILSIQETPHGPLYFPKYNLSYICSTFTRKLIGIISKCYNVVINNKGLNALGEIHCSTQTTNECSEAFGIMDIRLQKHVKEWEKSSHMTQPQEIEIRN